MMEDFKRCSHPGCDARGTHRTVVILLSEGEPPLVKKWDPVMPRCSAHLTRDPEVFLTEEAWNRLQTNFVVQSRGAMAVRARTTVQYAELDQPIAEIPVLVQTKKDGLVETGKALLIEPGKARLT